jgi:beta-galactosidase
MQNGWVAEYAFYVSEDGKKWGDPVIGGSFAADAKEKEVRFLMPRRCRFIRLVALAGAGGTRWAAVAELDVVAAEK